MKVLVPLFASGFFALASAQDQLSFGAPALGQQFTAGDNFIVRLDQHNTSHNQIVFPAIDTPGKMSIDIVSESCNLSSGCPNSSGPAVPANLFSGLFRPEPVLGKDGFYSQNFSLRIPPDSVEGTYALRANGELSLSLDNSPINIVIEIQVVAPAPGS